MQERILINGLPKSATTGLYSDIVKALSPDVVGLFEPVDNANIEQSRQIQDAMQNGKKLVVKLVCVDHDDGESNIIRVPVPAYDSFTGYEKKVFMVRDPRDNLVSFMLYMVVNSRRLILRAHAARLVDLIREKEADPGSCSVRRILEFMGEINKSDYIDLFMRWRNYSVSYLDRNTDYFTLKYEDYVASNTADLESYLGLQIGGDKEVPRHFSFVARTRKSGDWKNWFLAEDVEYFRPLLESYMSKYAYQDDWDLVDSPVLEPEKASAYVAMLVDDFYKKYPKYGQVL